jgi:competence protein ComFC
MMKVAWQWVEHGIGLVYPRNCLFCSMALTDQERDVICAACLSTVRRIEPPFCQQCASPFAGAVRESFVCGYCQDLRFAFARAVCACRAEGIVRESIHRFKYNREMYLGPHLAEWLIEAARQWIDWQTVDAIVPVPLHPRKKREREFNQSEYLSAALSRYFDRPLLVGELHRVKDTVTQTALDAEQRHRNLRNAFAARRVDVISRKRLVLVDDVFTTGATLNSCAKVLRRAGAHSVIALAVARGM